MSSRPPERRRRLPGSDWAKCFRNSPDAACGRPSRLPAGAGCPCSRFGPTPTSFLAAGRRNCSRRIRREGRLAGHQRCARAGLAQPSAPRACPCLVRLPREGRMGHLRLHSTGFHPALLQSRLHPQRGLAPGRSSIVAAMDRPQNPPVLAVAERRQRHDLCPHDRSSAGQRRLAGRSRPSERRPVGHAGRTSAGSRPRTRTGRSHPDLNLARRISFSASPLASFRMIDRPSPARNPRPNND